ncbi:cocaine- and amphetamine-regulated transcript-like [Trichomycterus rosablanca]|uniref:cocaine- and amphetamine-regulated transcript-like n=1 Tax=Trichomycterus rosablanca TaxID=2290929 RepID=UPI002F359563
MESTGMVIRLLLIVLVFAMSSGQHPPEISEEEQKSDINSDKELTDAIDEFMSRFQNRLGVNEKRAIPTCVVGTRCAMRFGPRFGQLCECTRGSYCNSYLLRCI